MARRRELEERRILQEEEAQQYMKEHEHSEGDREPEEHEQD